MIAVYGAYWPNIIWIRNVPVSRVSVTFDFTCRHVREPSTGNCQLSQRTTDLLSPELMRGSVSAELEAARSDTTFCEFREYETRVIIRRMNVRELFGKF
jgi:hypothetical protein